MLAADFPVQTLCELLALPASTYYYHPHGPADLEMREAIEAIAVEFPRDGYRRITAELKRRGWKVNHKHVLRLMREENLLVECGSIARRPTASMDMDAIPISSKSWRLFVQTRCGQRISRISACSGNLCTWPCCSICLPAGFGAGSWLAI